VRLVAFCEAAADFRLLVSLIDRVLRGHATWVADLLDGNPEDLRVWEGDGQGNAFFAIKHIKAHGLRILHRMPQGNFGGQAGGFGATMARTAFEIVRAVNASRTTDPIDAVVFVWDMDGQAQERQQALQAARNHAMTIVRFPIVLGMADRMREAWVLAGFDPGTPVETALLAAERQQLGFQPNHEAHLLTAVDVQAPRSPKRVLKALTADDLDREERCWTTTPLDTLRARGTLSGLAKFLDEVETTLRPLC
jgi:hypothetical protein